MLTYHQISLKLLFAYKLSYKKSKSVNPWSYGQAQLLCFSFQDASTCKGQADLHSPDMNRVA